MTEKTADARLTAIETDMVWVKESLTRLELNLGGQRRNGLTINLATGGLGGVCVGGIVVLLRVLGIG